MQLASALHKNTSVVMAQAYGICGASTAVRGIAAFAPQLLTLGCVPAAD
jgi:uncharacterized membrane protein YadS